MISAVGTLGRCYLVKPGDRFYFKDASVLWFEKICTISSEYIMYAFQSNLILDQVMDKSMGATVGTLTITRAKNIQIPLPPLPTQRAIVARLDAAFARIDRARANLERNVANAKELFQAKLNEVFSRRGDGSTQEALGELVNITSSKRIFKSDYVKDGVPFFRSKEIKELAYGKPISTELFISLNKYNKIRKKFGVPTVGDILITAVGTIGEMWVVNNESPFYFKDGNILWLSDFPKFDAQYLKYQLQNYVEELQNISVGSAYKALTIVRLKKQVFYVPDINTQKDVVQLMQTVEEHHYNVIRKYKHQLQHLTYLKHSLLQKAFRGELIAEAEAGAEADYA